MSTAPLRPGQPVRQSRAMLALAAIGVLCVTACDRALDPGFRPDRTPVLQEVGFRRTLWRQLGITDYSFDYTLACECPDATTQPVRVTVENDEILHVRDAMGVDVPAQPGRPWPTMDSLFTWALQSFANTDLAVAVQFDSLLFYPVRLRSFVLSTQSDLVDHRVANWVAN